MHDLSEKAVSDRLDALEAENRRLRARISRANVLAAFMIAAIGCSAVMVYLREFDEIHTKRLVLLDANNETRAILENGKAGGASFVLFGQNRQPRIGMYLSELGVATMQVSDQYQKKGVRVGTNAEGSSWLIFSDGVGNDGIEKSRINLGMFNEGYLAFDFRAKDNPETVLFRTESAIGGATRVCINNKEGDDRIQILANPDGSAAVLVAESSLGKKVSLAAYPPGGGGPSLLIFDSKKGRIAGMEVRKDGIPQVVLFDQQHRRIFETPLSSSPAKHQQPAVEQTGLTVPFSIDQLEAAPPSSAIDDR
jgi:hypothetical protein